MWAESISSGAGRAPGANYEKHAISFALLLSTFGAVVLMANCTVKESSGDDDDSSTSGCTKGKVVTGCLCTGNTVGSQTCGSDHKYGACECPDGQTSLGGSASNNGGESSTPTAGKTSTGGYSTGGAYGAGGAGGDNVSPAEGGAGGEAQGGAPAIDPTDCLGCLQALCQPQFDACTANDICSGANADDPGQSGPSWQCITDARADGLVTRDKVRGCGVTLGASSDPDNLAFAWAPEGMDPTTTELVNCLAMGDGDPDTTVDVSWTGGDARKSYGFGQQQRQAPGQRGPQHPLAAQRSHDTAAIALDLEALKKSRPDRVTPNSRSQQRWGNLLRPARASSSSSTAHRYLQRSALGRQSQRRQARERRRLAAHQRRAPRRQR